MKPRWQCTNKLNEQIINAVDPKSILFSSESPMTGRRLTIRKLGGSSSLDARDEK